MALLQIDLRPERRMLKRFGFVSLIVFGLVGTAVWRSEGLFGWNFPDAAPTVAAVLWTLAGLSLAFSLTQPMANRPLYVGLVILTAPIGFVVGWLILGIMWLGLITPTGFALRALGKDPMKRRLEPELPSYWDVRDDEPEVKRYFRQY